MGRDDLYGLREQIRENIRLIIGPTKHGDHFKPSSFLITTSYDEESYTAAIYLYAGRSDRAVMTGYPTATVTQSLQSLLEISSRVVNLMRDVRVSLPRDASEWWDRNDAGRRTSYPPGSWIDIALRFAPSNSVAAMDARLEAGLTRPMADYGLVHSHVRHSARRDDAGSVGGNGVWWRRSPDGPADEPVNR